MKKEIYTISVLDDKEFDALPYEGISDSIGFADPETGDAFVRKTGSKEMDALTIQHEIQELVSKESFHEDANGIRHKKWGKEVILPALTTIIGGVVGGPPGAAIGAGVGSAGSDALMNRKVDPAKAAISAAGGYFTGGAMAPGVEASKAAGGGILGQSLSGLQSAVGITPGAMAKPVVGLQGPVTQAQSQLGFSNLSQVPQNILGSAAAKTAAGAASGLQGPATAAQAAKGYPSLAQVPLSQIAKPQIIGSGLGAIPGGIGAGTPQAGQAGTPQIGQAGTPQIGQAGTSQIGQAGTPNVPAKAPFNIKDLIIPANDLGAGSV